MATDAQELANEPQDEIDNDDVEFSLADLAQLDASEIAEVRFEQLPAGLFTFRGTEAKLEEGTNRDDERRIILTLKMEVIEVHSVLTRMSDEDKAELLGKKHTEKQYIVPAKAAEGIGHIRALYADIDLPNGGAMGGVEGQPEGFIDGFVGHEFKARIVQRPRKGNPTEKDSNLRVEPKKKPKAA